MAYCVMRIEKANSTSMFRQMYEHHYRFKEPGNVDKDYEALNDTMVFPDEGDFIAAFYKKLGELDYYRDHSFRKNGVMAYDILLHYSPEAASWIDKEAWKEDNVKWLNKTFGKENVVSVVYHYDEAGYTEAGAIHGHAVVIPVDGDGKINAFHFTGGRNKMVELQDSYARAMEPHKLERGIRQSTAAHTPPKRFYAKLDNAIYGVPMPQRMPGEHMEKYTERIKDAWRTERAAHVRELRDKDREILEIKNSYKSDSEKDQFINCLQNQMEKYDGEKQELEREFGSMTNAKDLAHAMRLLNSGIEGFPDEPLANRAADDAAKLIEWAENEEKRKGKKKEEEIEARTDN